MELITRQSEFLEGDKGVFTLQFSSETPVKRGSWSEVLDHSTPENINLSRMVNGPILIDHKRSIESMVGVCEKAWIENGKGYCSIRFGTSELAQQVRADVEAGVVNSVSVGYSIEEFTDTDDLFTATRWSVHEISIVAVPADPTCRFIRSAEEINETSVDQETWERAFYKFQRQRDIDRVRSIELAFRDAPFDLSEVKQQAIKDGLSVEEFKQRAFEMLSNNPSPKRAASTFDGVQRLDQPEFSISKVIRSLSGDKSVDIGREIEVSRELELKGHRSSGEGIIVPVEALLNQRDFNVLSSGSELVGTSHRGDLFIDALRPHSIAAQIGVTMLNGLVGNVSIPKQTASATAQWLNLDGVSEITESNPETGNVTLSMKSLAALVPITYALLKQSAPQAEQMVKNDLLKVIAQGLDAALIAGTGADNQPTGVVNTTGVNTVTAADTTGKIPTYKELVSLFGKVAIANADVGRLGYLASPDIATELMSTAIDAGSGQMAWLAKSGNKGAVAGHTAMYSGSAPALTTIFGNWADAVIGTWGSIELAIDRNYKFAAGTIGVRCIHSCDIAIRNPQSFAKII
ncbi:TPA: phage major capsid protein [Vibrio parahaemolyticus]|nr:phage major capsid protein [Vibrio parahaemolyticus]